MKQPQHFIIHRYGRDECYIAVKKHAIGLNNQLIINTKSPITNPLLLKIKVIKDHILHFLIT